MRLSGIQRSVREASQKYGFLAPGSRVACGVSGGKDSMALLSVLCSLREQMGFELCAAVFAAGSYHLRPEGLPEEIRMHIAALGIPLLNTAIGGPGEKAPLTCYRCSALRRKVLLEAAAELGADSLALGHTRDDAAETALLELLEKGRPGYLAPKREYFGAISVIRPLIDVPGQAVEAYVRNHNIPAVRNSCPLSETSRRARARALLSECRRLFPGCCGNLIKAAESCRK
ncbi:MAG: hypothetical protein IJT95_04925 [Abditibacteriota bacterium]|nr:hypothetical protein [Abditibacteriota bacterium]